MCLVIACMRNLSSRAYQNCLWIPNRLTFQGAKISLSTLFGDVEPFIVVIMLVTTVTAVSRAHLKGVHGLEVARLARAVAPPRGLLALLGALAIHLILNVCMDRGCMASALYCNSRDQLTSSRAVWQRRSSVAVAWAMTASQGRMRLIAGGWASSDMH